MELTGELYGFYTNREITVVFEELKEMASAINYQYYTGTFYGNEILFFYKDDAMRRYHEEHGYNTDLNGEGCYYIEAKKTKLIGIASLFEFEGDSNFDPQDINLAFNNVFYYLLTIPDIIEENAFSKKIHHSIRDILTKD